MRAHLWHTTTTIVPVRSTRKTRTAQSEGVPFVTPRISMDPEREQNSRMSAPPLCRRSVRSPSLLSRVASSQSLSIKSAHVPGQGNGSRAAATHPPSGDHSSALTRCLSRPRCPLHPARPAYLPIPLCPLCPPMRQPGALSGLLARPPVRLGLRRSLGWRSLRHRDRGIPSKCIVLGQGWRWAVPNRASVSIQVSFSCSSAR